MHPKLKLAKSGALQELVKLQEGLARSRCTEIVQPKSILGLEVTDHLLDNLLVSVRFSLEVASVALRLPDETLEGDRQTIVLLNGYRRGAWQVAIRPRRELVAAHGNHPLVTLFANKDTKRITTDELLDLIRKHGN